MRFMMMVKIPSGLSEEDYSPDAELVGEMTKYNAELSRAGVLLALDGLHPDAGGARVTFAS